MFLPFQYYDPANLGEFIKLTQQFPQHQILAGGTDLLVKMRNGWQPCEHVIDIKKITDIPELHLIQPQENGLLIGSLVTFTQMKDNPIIKEKFNALYDACCVMGCFEIRNRATIGGNICNAASGAESGSPLLVFDAQVYIDGKNGQRNLFLKDFYQVITDSKGRSKPGVALQSGEIVTHFFLPYLPKDSDSIYLRRSRTQGMDLATLNLAMAITNISSLESRQFRIAGGALGPIPYRFSDVEKQLQGQEISPESVLKTKQKLSEIANPRAGSKRGSVAYKKDQIAELFELAIAKLYRSEFSSL